MVGREPNKLKSNILTPDIIIAEVGHPIPTQSNIFTCSDITYDPAKQSRKVLRKIGGFPSFLSSLAPFDS